MFPDEALEISWKSINKARAPLGKLEKPTRNGKKLQFSRCQLDNCGFQSGLKYFHQLSMYLVNSIISFILDINQVMKISVPLRDQKFNPKVQ